MRRSTELAILALVVAAGVWPWLGELERWPMTPDSVTWIERAAPLPDWPAWLEWTFLSSHFDVGWRPLTALSFTANRLLAGLEPLLYRGTDIALHALAAWLVAAVARRLAPGLPPWSRWLAAALFLAHPVAGEVVPFLARRSYSLATVLSLTAVLVYLAPLDGAQGDARGGAPRPARGTSLAAGVLLALGLAANEVAVLAAAALPFLARAHFGVRAPVLSASTAWLAVPATIALALRTAVVGGLGGYELDEGAGALEVFAAAWREIGGAARAPAMLAWAAGALALAYYAWRACAERRLTLVLALWVAAHPLLYAGQGVWFPRQAYVAIPPLALLVALSAAGTWTGRRGWRRAAELAPQVGFAALLLLGSPLVRGGDPARAAERDRRQALIDAALADLAQVARAGGEPAAVSLVLPCVAEVERDDVLRAHPAERELTRASRVPARWLAVCLAGHGVEPRELVYVVDEGDRGQPLARLGEDGRTLRIRAGCVYYLAADGGEEPASAADREGRTKFQRREAAATREVTVPAGRVWIAGGD
jgi:hypothetical protein